MAGSSQELEPDELAALLARKATEDAVALREFAANTEIADSVLGFHAQQAIEKWLKAVLARHNDRLHESLGDVSPTEFESLYVGEGVQPSNPS
jgi:transposase InsO family protein